MRTLTKLLFITLIFNALSCNSSNQQATQKKQTDNSEIRFENFAKQLEISIKSGDYKNLNTSWDIELFKQKVLDKGKVATNMLESGEKYFRKVIFKVNNDMVDEVKQYGSIVLSKFEYQNKSAKAFYTYKTDLGINFIEFELKEDNKEIKIIDFYNFQQGEYYSETVNKMISNINKYGTTKGAYFDAMELLRISVKQANKKHYESSWKTINAISDNLLSDNYFQYKRIMVARNISDELYYQAVEDFLALKPNNQKLQLFYKISLYHMKKDKKQLNKAANEMENIVGKSDLFSRWIKNV